MWKALYVIALAASVAIIGVHAVSDHSPKQIAPVVQLNHVQTAPCATIAKTEVVKPDQTKKKTASFVKKKNHKKKFSGGSHPKHKHHHKHHSHPPSHSHAPAKTFPSHAPPGSPSTGPPCR